MKKNTPMKAPVSHMPMPPDLINLPTIEAKPWLRIDPGLDILLEGPSFDREGNLYVTSPPTGTVFRITPKKQVSIIFDDKKVAVNGSAFHRDGRLFIVCLTGELMTINISDYGTTFMYPKYQRKNLEMNDLVFDMKGNLYVTNFTGTVMNPTGGVFLISSDATTVQPVVLGLASPNGISLSPLGDVLWIGESSRNAILRVALLTDGITVKPVVGVLPVLYSVGCSGPDSNKVDSAGNLYQCITGQGRIVVLNELGIPIANVIVPGRDDRKSLKTTNSAFKPDTNEGYITTSGLGGAWICVFKGLAKGLKLF